MKNGKAELPSEPLWERLNSCQELRAIVGNRIKPNKPTPGEEESQKPYVTFWRITGGGAYDLGGRSGLQNYMFRIEFHADTDKQAEVIREIVLDRLCGNAKRNIEPWVDRSQGVQGCFAADDADADTDDDGQQISGQTFSLWFCPQV